MAPRPPTATTIDPAGHRRRNRERGFGNGRLVISASRLNGAGDKPRARRINRRDRGAYAIRALPDLFGKLLAEETEKWGKVIRAANIKPQ